MAEGALLLFAYVVYQDFVRPLTRPAIRRLGVRFARWLLPEPRKVQLKRPPKGPKTTSVRGPKKASQNSQA